MSAEGVISQLKSREEIGGLIDFCVFICDKLESLRDRLDLRDRLEGGLTGLTGLTG